MKFGIDSAAGAMTEITSYVNQGDLAGSLSLLEDTAAGDGERTFVPELAGATTTINGFVNSTTDGIFGPLIGNDTSVSKTYYYYNGIRYYTGEVYPSNVQYSGNVDTLQTWSVNLTFDGAVTRTSVAPS